jgi:hypothetical protein
MSNTIKLKPELHPILHDILQKSDGSERVDYMASLQKMPEVQELAASDIGQLRECIVDLQSRPELVKSFIEQWSKNQSTRAYNPALDGMRGGGFQSIQALRDIQNAPAAKSHASKAMGAKDEILSVLNGFPLKVKSAARRAIEPYRNQDVYTHPILEALKSVKISRVSDTESCQRVNKAVRQAVQNKDHERLNHLVSVNVATTFAQALGPQGTQLLKLYESLAKTLRDKEPLSKDFCNDLGHALENLSNRPLPNGERLPASLRNQIHSQKSAFSTLLEGGLSARAMGIDGPACLDQLRTLITDIGVSQDIYVHAVQQDGIGSRLRMMSERERQLSQLKYEDPQAFGMVQKRRQLYKHIDRAIHEALQKDGLEPQKMKILGRLVHTGKDAVTGELWVFDLDGERLSIDAFKTKRLAFLDSQKKLEKLPKKASLTAENLREVDEESLEALDGPVTYVSITDDQAKDNALTRIYPCLWHGERQVVSEGRFRGCYLDTVVTNHGRLIEGCTYRYDPRTGRTLKATGKDTLKEPYVVMSKEKKGNQVHDRLFLELPFFQGSWTSVRQQMRQLSKLIPSIDYREGSKNTGFYFDAKDFAVVRETVGGLAMSNSAHQQVRSYFEDLAEAERATASDNLSSFSAEAIGGFRKSIRGRRGEILPITLQTHQKKALAWLEANGNRGVCALDTGMGKTITAIAMMQKLVRDGFDQDPQSNHKFLFVCPPALRGNLSKEIRKFLEPEAAKTLLQKVDIMSFGSFRSAQKSGTYKGKPFDGEKYAAVFFDEAQALKNLNTKTSKAALALNHPRKICLTASPMERNPMEAYVLAAVTRNIDLGHRVQGKDFRKEMRLFRKRFCETLGGRVIGVKSSPLTKQDLDTWVKRNIFYSAKTDVPEYRLPDLHQETETLDMSPEVEKAYRKATAKFSKVMEGMVSLYRDQGRLKDGKINPNAKDKRISQVFGLKFREVIQNLNTLANMPEELIAGAGYPKLDRAAQLINDQLERSDGASRSILFSDDKAFVLKSAEELSRKLPGKIHAACLNDKIHLFKNGQELNEYDGYALPFKAKAYRRFPDSPSNKGDNVHYRVDQWQQFVLGELLSQDQGVGTLSLLGQTYQQGQNLQAFDTVIHLDRDTWNSEDMKQRTARSWRQGQGNPVNEITLDMVYGQSLHDQDQSLDSIRKHYQSLEGNIFDAIIKGAQHTELGKEWHSMEHRHASFMKLDEHVMELMNSPYAERSRPPQWQAA